jgi:hypothetical protein
MCKHKYIDSLNSKQALLVNSLIMSNMNALHIPTWLQFHNKSFVKSIFYYVGLENIGSLYNISHITSLSTDSIFILYPFFMKLLIFEFLHCVSICIPYFIPKGPLFQQGTNGSLDNVT